MGRPTALGRGRSGGLLSQSGEIWTVILTAFLAISFAVVCSVHLAEVCPRF